MLGATYRHMYSQLPAREVRLFTYPISPISTLRAPYLQGRDKKTHRKRRVTS